MRRFGPLLTSATPSGCRARAAVGFVVWLLCVTPLAPGWAEALLLLGPLAVIPLGLALAVFRGPDPGGPLLRLAVVAQLPTALPLLGVPLLPVGPAAAILALPWVVFTVALAGAGCARLTASEGRSPEAVCAAAALLFPVVGGGWLALSALGARPLAFSSEIVRATAIHFHYAGFALPLLAARAAAARPGLASRIVCVGVVIGVPLVALGITLSTFGVRLPEWLAAWFLASACLVLAVRQLGLALRPRRAQLLQLTSGLSLAAGMALAALYAWGNYWGPVWLDIPLMVRTHGLLNALGFALPGLLAWNIADESVRERSPRVEVDQVAARVEV